MNSRLRDPRRVRFSIALLLVYVGACRLSVPGGSQAVNSELTADRGVTSTPFAEGEVWFLSSDTTTGQSGLAYLTVSGVGDLVSSIQVVTDVFTNDLCLIRSPDSTFGDFPPETPSLDSIDFEFDGASMRLSANSQDQGSFEGCSVEFTASVARRGAGQTLFGFNNFDVSVQGEALVSGESVRFAPLQLSRVRTPRPIACEESLTVLDGLSWTLSNVKPATDIFSFSMPPSADATVVNIYGSDETISSVDLFGGSFAGCSGTGGAFSFDGTNLSFESSFTHFEPSPFDPDCNDDCPFAFDGECDDGREGAATDLCPAGGDCADCGPLVPIDSLPLDPDCNDSCEFALNGQCDDGRGDIGLPVIIRCPPGTDCADCGPVAPQPPPCSITFSGKVAECGVFLSPILGFVTAAQVLRIEGTGSFTDGENPAELTTVYLSINRGGPGP